MANLEMQDLVEIQDNKAKSASKVHLVLLDQLEMLDLPASQDGTDNRDNQEEMVKRVAERLELKDNPVAQEPQASLAKTDNPEPQASKAHPDQQETKANQASPDPRDTQVALDPLDCPARTQHTVLAHHAVPSSSTASNNRRHDNVRKTNTTKYDMPTVTFYAIPFFAKTENKRLFSQLLILNSLTLSKTLFYNDD
jgi:hypothetical protein